jgi:hypothetical protein
MEENSNKTEEKRGESGRFLPGTVHNPTGRPKKGNAWDHVYNQILDSDKIEITLRSIDTEGGMV